MASTTIQATTRAMITVMRVAFNSSNRWSATSPPPKVSMGMEAAMSIPRMITSARVVATSPGLTCTSVGSTMAMITATTSAPSPRTASVKKEVLMVCSSPFSSPAACWRPMKVTVAPASPSSISSR